MRTSNPSRTIRYVALALLLISVAVTRFVAPFQTEATHDETLHIVGYDSHADQEKFVGRFSHLKRFIGPDRTLRLQQSFYSNYGLKRLQYTFLRDAHPPLFPVIAELSELLFPAKLLPPRLLAAVVGVAFIAMFYLAGAAYQNQTTGLWLATLATISLSFRVYAGINRPYVYAQFAVALVFWSFLRRKGQEGAPIGPFLAAALFAQFTDWMVWLTIAPLLAATCISRYRATRSVVSLLREGWWYVFASILLLLQCAVQLTNPTISAQMHGRKFAKVWQGISLAMPFAEPGHLWASWTLIGALLFVVCCGVGLWSISRDTSRPAIHRYALLISLLLNVVMLVRSPQGVRFAIVPITVLCFAAALGIDRLLQRLAASELVCVCVLAASLCLYFWRPESPYQRVFDEDTPYSPIVRQMKAVWKPGDVWYPVPDFSASDLYLYGAPAPRGADGMREEAIQSCRTVQSCLIYSRNYGDEEARRFGLPNMHPSDDVWIFPNGHVLFRVPHLSTTGTIENLQPDGASKTKEK